MKRQTVQLKYFCTKFTSCAQNVHHRPKRICSDVCEIVDSFVNQNRCLWQVIPDLLQCTFLALGWSLALGEVCEMPKALHPTHGSQVG